MIRTLLVAVVLGLASSGAAAESDDALPSFAETCFQARPATSFLVMPDAQRMLEGVGQDSRLFPGDRNKVRLKGLFRIRDWTPQNALRVSLTEWNNHLRFYVWGEGHGVAILVSPAGAAYRITQEPNDAMTKPDLRPVLAALLTTDDRRGARLPPGAYQIRCQDGAVVVSKGDARLMTVPLEGAAKNLYLQVPNDATLQDLALTRSGSIPEEISSAHRIVLDGSQPSKLPWKATLPKGARFQKLENGCVELAAENTTETVLASVAIARPGLFEVIAQIDEVTPGTGFALLNAKGEPLDGIEFGREGNTTLAFALGSPRDQPWLGNFDFANRPVTVAGPRQWLRLIVAGGSTKCWISGDGLHWGRILYGRDGSGAWQSIALYTRETSSDRKNPDIAARHIRLRSLQVRELSGLVRAVAPDLLANAAAAGVAMKLEQGESPQAWTQRIAPLAPKGCSPATWRYACMLHALAAPVQIDSAEQLLYRAIGERLNELRSARAKIDLLEDAALLWRSRQDSAQRQLEFWDRLGREVLNAGSRAEFELYQQAAMQVSLGEPQDRSGPLSWELVRDALILFYDAQRNSELVHMEHLLVFWRTQEQVGSWPVGQHLDALLKYLNIRPMGKSQRRRGPAIEVNDTVTPPLNRAASNILSELLPSLQSKQYADAARNLITCVPPPDEGLVPAPDDDQLFISFRTELPLLMSQHPGFGEAMARQVGPADQLKIEQALAQGDSAAVEALHLQYCGTPAAALPCQWLGDRALAATDIVRAASWYDEGLRWASPEQMPDLAARKRLVSAMLGSTQGRPPKQPVSFGTVKVSPEQFESWIGRLLSRRQASSDVDSAATTLPKIAAAEPVQFQAATFGKLDDASGRGFKYEEAANEFREVDWTWRHLTVLCGDDSVFAVERSRITAFDLSGGKVRWDFRLRNGWSPVPVRPLVCGQRIYIRTGSAPDRTGLACLDSKTGRKLWLSELGGTAASDPLWYRGRLFVLAIGPTGGQFVSPLCLVELHPETGNVISTQEILETSDREKQPNECQATWVGNRLVVLLAGTVFTTDSQGRILWLRQETSLPYGADPGFVHRHYQPAIESEGRLFVQQPGSCVIDCLALETGDRYWRRGIVGLQRIVDLPHDRLLVTTTRGLVGLRKTTGEVLWQREFPGIPGMPGMLSGLASTTSGLLLGTCQATAADKQQIEFLWIDPATGQTQAHGLVPLEKNQPIHFGPFATRGDRTWCCFGYHLLNDNPTAENPKRIIELRPGKPATAGEAP